MCTKKKHAFFGLCLAVVAWAALLAGCSPSAPDALLDGKRLLDRGQPESAVRKLREATSLMPTNAMAWGYLGLAYQQGGSSTNAMEAYARALSLSPDLAEVRFNLGCLWMGQGQWAQAREQFAAATVLQKNFAIAWQRLGEAQVRLGEHAAAVQSLGESLRLNPSSADAWNWLGVAQLRQGHTQEALRSFQSALRLQTNHGPALLNLAILHQTKLEHSDKALELYRQYLAYVPNAMNAREVRGVADRLEAELRLKPQAEVASQVPAQKPSEKANTESSSFTARPVNRTSVVRPSEPAPPIVKPVEDRAVVRSKPPEQPPLRTVTVKPATPVASATSSPPTTPTPGVATTASRDGATIPSSDLSPRSIQSTDDDSPRRRGFFARVNPLNLFKKKSREKKPTPLPPRSESEGQGAVQVESALIERPQAANASADDQVDVKNPDRFKRYRYRSGATPSTGDIRAAKRAFDKAEKLRMRGKSAEAIQGYLKAVQVDPSHFAAHFNLGLLYLQRRELSSALEAFEMAARIQPGSSAARYNFALTLKSAGYPVDAARELLTLLSEHPEDARSHLMLGNLYAQQFGDKAKARDQYQRVLELAPGHPQAGSIHLWLVQNPL